MHTLPLYTPPRCRKNTPDLYCLIGSPGGGLLFDRHPPPLTRRHVVHYCSALYRNEVILRGLGQKGVQLRRKIVLPENAPVVRTETVAENTGAAPVPVVLTSCGWFDVGLPGDPGMVLGYRAQDGKVVEKLFFRPGEETAGSKEYKGAQRPDGSWSVWHRAGGPRIFNRFSKEQVSICHAWWYTRDENRIWLALRSEERLLGPGQSMKLEADYGLE